MPQQVRSVVLWGSLALLVIPPGIRGDSIQEDIAAASSAMMRAVAGRDSAAIAAILEDEFILTSSETPGPLVTKAQYLAGALDPAYLVVDHFRFHSFRVSRRGDVVVAHSRLEWRSTLKGQPWNADFLNTDVWVHESGRWQLLSRHTSYPKDGGRILRGRS
jgi:ketosteroid isomerase-like protein